MTRKQTEMIVDAIDSIIAGLGSLKRAVAGLEDPVSLCDKFPAEFEATRPKPKPIQLKLPVGGPVEHRERLGDAGYADSANPVRQAVGQLGGLATTGRPRAKSPDRRRRGSVMVKLMDVNQKRRYWRWCDDRKRARAAGRTPQTWTQWVDAGEKLV